MIKQKKHFNKINLIANVRASFESEVFMNSWFVSWEFRHDNGNLQKGDFVFTGEEPDNPAQLIRYLKEQIVQSESLAADSEKIIFVAFNKI